MDVTIEISLYPLKNRYINTIEAFIESLKKQGLNPQVNALSTQISGDIDVVLPGVRASIKECYTKEQQAILVMKLLNGNLLP